VTYRLSRPTWKPSNEIDICGLLVPSKVDLASSASPYFVPRLAKLSCTLYLADRQLESLSVEATDLR
jgi:hypothetical protein